MISPRSLAAVGVVFAVVSACGERGRRFTEPVVLGGVEVAPDVLERGHVVFDTYCAPCHGDDGTGNGPAAGPLPTKPRDFREAVFQHKSTPGEELPTDDDLRSTILGGLMDEGMPPFATLTTAEVEAVIQYIKTFSPRWRS